MSWIEFRDLATGLLQSPDARLFRATRPPDPEPDVQMPDWTMS